MVNARTSPTRTPQYNVGTAARSLPAVGMTAPGMGLVAVLYLIPNEANASFSTHTVLTFWYYT